MGVLKGETVLLVGVPNCGKSALFCALTGGHARVGNWAGVTVEKKEGRIRGTAYTLVDTPGICGLEPTREEEKVTTDAIEGGDFGLVVQVVDGQAPERSFRLTRELLSRRVPLLLAVSRRDLYEARGQTLNCPGVSRETGVPVLAVSGRTGTGVEELRTAICRRMKEYGEEPFKPGTSRIHTAPADWAKMLLGGSHLPRGTKVDRWLMGSRWGYLLAGGTLTALLTLTTLAFSLFSGVWETASSRGAEWVRLELTRLGLGEFLACFISDGLLGSFFTALSFLIPLFCFFLMTALLEDCGYLARISFLWDRCCARVGLTGGVVLPLTLSFGCGVTGIAACRTLSSVQRRGCAGFCTYFPCHAKLPVIACVAGYCHLGVLGTLALFSFPCLVGLAAVILAGRGGGIYLEEIPPLSLPAPRVVGRSAVWRTREFLSRAGGVIALSGAVIWLLSHVGEGLRPVEMDESFLAWVGKGLYRVFAPLGFASWQGVTATLAGLIAKENAVVVLSLLGGEAGLGTTAQAVSFCLFNLLCPPCVTAMAEMRRTLGRRAWLFLLAQVLIAAFTAGAWYRLALWFGSRL